ncbi:hypothetical protein J6590_029749 [Homalodisca vitripennis]|nr:hypothetical protein J6590_029749 [Homalodisca vitripennis]
MNPWSSPGGYYRKGGEGVLPIDMYEGVPWEACVPTPLYNELASHAFCPSQRAFALLKLAVPRVPQPSEAGYGVIIVAIATHARSGDAEIWDPERHR